MSGIKTTQAREQILARVRKALSAHQTPIPFPEVEKWDAQEAYATSNVSLDEQFAQNFVALGGRYVYCQNEQEMLDSLEALNESRSWNKLFCADRRLLKMAQNNHLNFILPTDIADESADACITTCEALVARTGSFLMSSRQDFGRVSSVFYPVHIVVAYKNDLVADIAEAYTLVHQRYGDQQPSMLSLQTGPSRTADIEKTLVTGVHGPKEVFCFFVNA